MGINIVDQFNYQGSKFNFERDAFDTLAEMKEFPETSLPPKGFECYCVETDKKYRFDRSNDIDETTGKWREVEGGGSTDIYKIGDITVMDTSDVSSINDVLGTVSDLRSAISNKKVIIAQTEVGVFPVICSDESSYITLSVTVGKGMGYYTVGYAGTEWTSMSVDSVEFATKDDTISNVNVSVDNNTGIPNATASVNGNTITFEFNNIKGEQGNSGVSGSTDNIEVVNNLDGGESTPEIIKVLAAEQGKILNTKIVGLEGRIKNNETILNCIKKTDTDGFYICDENGNIGAGFDKSGNPSGFGGFEYNVESQVDY